MTRPRIAVLTSGGDSPGMNAAIRAVVREAIHRGGAALGVRSGYEGLLEGDVVRLELRDVGGVLDRGGTFLGTARSERMFTPEGLDRAAEVLAEEGVTGLAVIGGNGSLRGAEELHERGVKVVGIPATIDNDIGWTDASIGFDSALNTIADMVSKVRDTASSHARTFVIEVMGRESGMLALYGGLATGADLILVPEVPFEFGELCESVVEGVRRGKRHTIVVVAEGAGSGVELAARLTESCRQEVRAVVLGHTQRGGSPSAFDRVLASRLGAAAVDALIDGDSGVMVGMRCREVERAPLAEGYVSSPTLPDELIELARVIAR